MSEIQFSVLDQLDQLEEIVLEGSRIPFSGGTVSYTHLTLPTNREV